MVKFVLENKWLKEERVYEEKIKKAISMVLTVVLLSNVFVTNIEAQTGVWDDETTVYVDGVEFNITLNDDFEIEVEGHTEVSDAFMLIDQNGNGEVEIENDERNVDSEEYELEIEDLSRNDVDIEVYEDGDKIEEISSVNEIIEDTYNGQACFLQALFGKS